MQANILPLHIYATPGVGLKVKPFFSKSSHISYQMNLKGGYAHTMLSIPLVGLGCV